MKNGSKGGGKVARAQERPASTLPSVAIPFPPGTAYNVAEEGRPVPHFTVREQQVGGWLADGKTDPEIARILGMGIETVRTHIKSMRDKTGVENRSALFAWIWWNRFVAYFGHVPGKPVKYQ